MEMVHSGNKCQQKTFSEICKVFENIIAMKGVVFWDIPVCIWITILNNIDQLQLYSYHKALKFMLSCMD
jgi:hypothetical protein